MMPADYDEARAIQRDTLQASLQASLAGTHTLLLQWGLTAAEAGEFLRQAAGSVASEGEIRAEMAALEADGWDALQAEALQQAEDAEGEG